MVILNGYYVLPLGYAWAVLLENFIDEVDRYDGRPMGEAEMAKVSSETVRRTKRVYPGVPAAELREDLEQMIGVLFDVARGDMPRCEIGAMSLREYAPHMTAPPSDGPDGECYDHLPGAVELQSEMPPLLCRRAAGGAGRRIVHGAVENHHRPVPCRRHSAADLYRRRAHHAGGSAGTDQLCTLVRHPAEYQWDFG